MMEVHFIPLSSTKIIAESAVRGKNDFGSSMRLVKM